MKPECGRGVVALVLFVLTAVPAAGQEPGIRGFPTSMLEEQRERESLLRSVPEADSIRARLRLLSEEPHHAGFPGSLEVAELILAKFRSAGLDAELERFEALMPVPVTRRLELLGPEPYVARLIEPALPEDKDSGDANGLPPYNAYSPDGDVTAPLVFVNYGLPEDYEVLDSLGIDVAGKIVIAKYGRSWRGIKPKVAAEHGALATILYSDPEDDGYFVQDVYPEGPMRPWFGVQRGSVMDMPTYPGDPQSPGWASVEGARKIPIDEVTTFSPIPVLPISYGDAQPLLEALGGPVAPEDWRGTLPFTYHVGPSSADVRLTLAFDWEVRPLYNVVATIEGAVSPEQWVVWGNHHDAWVNGA
ncbi:MAG: PA domain-containing protein, partial [Longimicrobiales bacterium]